MAITLGLMSDFTGMEWGKLQQACGLVNYCLADTKFIAQLMDLDYANTDDSNDQIVGKLTAPITVDRLYCENLGWWATHWSKTVAKEAPDGSITFNRAFFDRQSSASLANTLIHEACHVIGFSHRSPRDSFSVPYQVGNELERFAQGLQLQSTVNTPAVSVV